MRNNKRKKTKKIVVAENCPFCATKTEPNYKEFEAIGRFLTDRGKLVPRSRSGLCAKHQRPLVREIKRARYLALLPFVARVKK